MTDTIKPMQGLAAYLRCEARHIPTDNENHKTLMTWAREVEAAIAAPQPEGDAERQERDMVTAYDLFSNLKLHGEYAALKVAFGSLWPAAFSHGFQTAKVIYKPESQPVPPVKLTDAQITSAAKSLGIGSYQTLAAAFKAGVKFAETDALMPVLTDAEIVDAIQHLYQGRAVAEMAAKVSMDEFRAIEAAVRTGGAG